MRWNLWLAQSETERSLGMVLRIAVAVVAFWTLAAAYSLWSTRAALAAVQLAVVSQSNQMSQIARDLPKKRREARNAAAVKALSSRDAGSAEITEELAEIAQATGAQVRGVRISEAGQAVQAIPAAQAAPAPAGTVTGYHETFECNITGEYEALTRFLNGLATSPQPLDITALQVTKSDDKHSTDAPILEMKISGIVDEDSEKL